MQKRERGRRDMLRRREQKSIVNEEGMWKKGADEANLFHFFTTIYYYVVFEDFFSLFLILIFLDSDMSYFRSPRVPLTFPVKSNQEWKGLYVYASVCVCVYVCVCERDRGERECVCLSLSFFPSSVHLIHSSLNRMMH